MSHRIPKSQRGQTLVLFTLMLPVLLLLAGLVVDVGYGLSQQRQAQNAADFSALAGARVLGEFYTGKPAGAGTDANVSAAINSVLAANNTEGAGAEYVDQFGIALGSVGTGSIPDQAAGIVVRAKTTWHTFILGTIGVNQWSAGVSATAVAQGVPSAGVLPIAVKNNTFMDLPYCDPYATDFVECVGGNSGSASAKVQGGFFGWLAFGATGKCAGFGLGMIVDGCRTSQRFLDSELGPPINSYGCCTQLDPTASNNFIGSATGNMPANFSAYINPSAPVILWTPVWDYTGGTGAGGYYHIVGFGAIVIVGTDTQHGEWFTAVRVSPTYGNSPNGELISPTGAVYLVR